MLPQNLLSQERKLKLRWFVMLSTMPLLGVVTAFGLVPQQRLGLESNAPAIQDVLLPQPAPMARSENTYRHSERMLRGDTIDAVLRRLGLNDPDASAYLRTAEAATPFRALPLGSELQSESDAAGKLLSLNYLDKLGTRYTVARAGQQFQTLKQPALIEKRTLVRSAQIQSSLYAAADAVGLPDSTASKMADIFSGDIDFHHDLRKGDRFTVIYEMDYSNGMPVGGGQLLAAEFINRSTVYRAVYFKDGDRPGDYYTPTGQSVHKAFLRSPIAFSRISSGFTNSRFHPVLNKWRAHRGVDFAAPMGTPVKATSDGTILSVGYQNGYGKVIKMSHQSGHFSTVYGHLSRYAKGLKAGQRINQGEIIGYVGMTGVATGPHLHYEFKVDGLQRDPLKVALPKATPIDKRNMAAFSAASDDLVTRLNLLRNTNLARLD